MSRYINPMSVYGDKQKRSAKAGKPAFKIEELGTYKKVGGARYLQKMPKGKKR